MLVKKILLLLIVFCAFQSVAFAGEPIEISIAIKIEGSFRKPLGGVIRVGRVFPTIAVIVENISSSSQKLYKDDHVGELGSISFEIVDENKKRNVIERKIPISKSSMVSFRHMSPGESKMFEIVLDEGKWENAYKLYNQGARRCRARAIFYNGSKKLYSPYYEVIVEE